MLGRKQKITLAVIAVMVLATGFFARPLTAMYLSRDIREASNSLQERKAFIRIKNWCDGYGVSVMNAQGEKIPKTSNLSRAKYVKLKWDTILGEISAERRLLNSENVSVLLAE